MRDQKRKLKRFPESATIKDRSPPPLPGGRAENRKSVTRGHTSRQPAQRPHWHNQLYHTSQLMRLWYLSHRRPSKAKASLRIRAVSPEPSLFAHTKYRSRRRVRPKIRRLAHWMAAHARLKNEFTEDEKCHNLMSWLIWRRVWECNKAMH